MSFSLAVTHQQDFSCHVDDVSRRTGFNFPLDYVIFEFRGLTFVSPTLASALCVLHM